MKSPFARKRPKSKRDGYRRVGPDRVRLHGEDMTELRRRVFERSGGFCEALVRTAPPLVMEVRCSAPITWQTMELSHKAHGPRRDDSEDGTYASCADCHRVGVHNPKSCPRRPGKIMRIKHAQEYWNGRICFCDGPKKERESFCAECSAKLSPQIKHDLENADDPDTYRQALASAEIEIITAEERTA